MRTHFREKYCKLLTIKEFIDPKRPYALYFRNQLIPETFRVAFQTFFKNSAFEFLHCSNILDDVENIENKKKSFIIITFIKMITAELMKWKRLKRGKTVRVIKRFVKDRKGWNDWIN